MNIIRRLEDLSNRAVLGILLSVAGATSLMSLVTNLVIHPDITTWLEGWLQNFSTEMFGAFLTFVLLVMVARRHTSMQIESPPISHRDTIVTQDRIEDLQRLKALLASQENVVTKIAIAELRARGWLRDGSLRGASLPGANLQGAVLPGADMCDADLSRANLQNVDFRNAKLRDTVLSGANLQGVNLAGSNMHGALLGGTNLQGADLTGANLFGAVLYEADLQGANLFGINLQGANLRAVDLRNAKLRAVDMKRATMKDANLEGTFLWDSDLHGVDFRSANLRGTEFWRSDLQHANLFGAQCDETTLLPNGEKWTPDVDWSLFGAVEMGDWQEWYDYQRTHGLID